MDIVQGPFEQALADALTLARRIHGELDELEVRSLDAPGESGQLFGDPIGPPLAADSLVAVGESHDRIGALGDLESEGRSRSVTAELSRRPAVSAVPDASRCARSQTARSRSMSDSASVGSVSRRYTMESV